MIVVMVAGPGGDSLQGPEVLEQGALPLGRGPHGGQQVVAGLLVRGRAGVLRGCQHADPRALVPLVGPSTPAIISTKQPGTKSWQDIQPGRRRGLGRSRAPTTPDR